MLKQVLTVKETSLLIAAGTEHKQGDPHALYDYFCRGLDAALSETAEQLPVEGEAEDLPRLALGLALRSYADRLACERVLAILAERRPQPERQDRKKEKNK